MFFGFLNLFTVTINSDDKIKLSYKLHRHSYKASLENYSFILLTKLINPQITAVCFLAEGTARTFFLQSEFRKQNSCMGGNLMKIHKDTACQALKGPCQAKCDGASTRDVNTSKLYIFVHTFIIMTQGTAKAGRNCTLSSQNNIMRPHQGGSEYLVCY